MSLAVIHLSDIHLRSDIDNPITRRIDSIQRAIRALDDDIKCCILILSGDIAFSGKSTEYETATEFLKSLLRAISTLPTSPDVHVQVVPGNHDCDLRNGERGRLKHLNSIIDTKLGLQSPNTEDIAECLEVQNRFFEFCATALDKNNAELDSQLYWKTLVTFGNKTIAIKCFNTAWMTRKKELKGTLIAPHWLVPPKCESSLDISVFHHPVSWLESNNNSDFSRKIEQSSDLILTGHEHTPSAYLKDQMDKGTKIAHLEGDCLQDPDHPDHSGFYVYLFDEQINEIKTSHYTWRGDAYEPEGVIATRKIERNEGSHPAQLVNLSAFTDKLNDPGRGYKHPRKAELELRNIFVYPRVSKSIVQAGGQSIKQDGALDCATIAAYCCNHKHVIVIGPETSGKTTLAKILYSDLLSMGKFSIMCSGQAFQLGEIPAIDRSLEIEFAKQYASDTWEKFKQLDIDSKIVIVDDIEQANLNRDGWEILLERLEKKYGTVILFSREALQVEELNSQLKRPFDKYKRLTIREMGHRKRFDLIWKWLKLGRETTISDAELTTIANSVESVINTIIGPHIVPAQPFFILSLLQGYEAGVTNMNAAGAYGYHYEYLIKDRLNTLRTRLEPDDIDNLLENIAFHMLSHNRRTIQTLELQELVTTIAADQFISSTFLQSLPAIAEAKILESPTLGITRFSYGYIFHYFAAKYISSRLYMSEHEATLRGVIQYLVNYLHVDDFANVIIFIAYFTRDEKLITALLNSAASLYPEYRPCNYDSDLKFLDQITIARLTTVDIPSDDAANTQTNYRDELDNIETEIIVEQVHSDPEEHIEVREINELLKITVAIKLMQILGQVVRNTPAKLGPKLTKLIVESVYLLGMRMMSYFVQMLQSDIDNYINFVRERLRTELKIEKKEQLALKTNSVISDHVTRIGFCLIIQVSSAIGSARLRSTYKKMNHGNTPIPFSLFEISVDLNQNNMPESAIFNLKKDIDNKLVPFASLVWLVTDHFHKFGKTRTMRQRILMRLGIKPNDVQMMLQENKLL